MKQPSRLVAIAVVACLTFLGCSEEKAARKPTPAPSSKQPTTQTKDALVARCDQALRKAAQWLLTQVKEDGTFGGPAEVGKAALALSAILSTPDAQTLKQDPRVKKIVAYLVSMQQPDGSINIPGEKGLANYQTSAALAALVAYGDPAHEKVRAKARDFLLSIQNKEGNDFGSWGYNGDKRGDLSNTQFTLDALKAAGLDENSEAFKNCLVFLQRCQNRSESNDQPWATNDGGGIYYPGASKAGIIKLPDGRIIYKSYGSMTYALLRGYVLVGLELDDPRVQAALKWLSENYTLDHNPGMPEERKLQGLYYYFFSMAKALGLLGKPYFTAPDGTVRHWARDLATKLLELQQPEGYWVNNAMRWMENDKVLATAYATMALSEARAALAAKP